MIKNIPAGVLAVLLLCSTVACSRDAGIEIGASTVPVDESEQEQKGMYTAKDLDIGREDASFYAMKQVGDFLYFTEGSYDAEKGTGDYHICRYAVLSESTEELPVTFDRNPIMFDIGEDGSIYVVVYHYTEEEGGSQRLRKYDASGTLLYDTAIDEWTDTKNPDNKGNIVGISSDSEGRAYLVCQKAVFLFDGQGGPAGCVNLIEGYVDDAMSGACALCRGKDGKVYTSVTMDINPINPNGKGSLERIDFDGRTSETVWKDFPGLNASFGVGPEKDFLVNDGFIVYEYDLENQVRVPLLSWADSGILGDKVCIAGIVSDGKILAVLYGADVTTRDIKLLTRLSPEEVGEREELVLGSIHHVAVIDKMVAAFNQSSLKYQVTIKDYLPELGYTKEELEDAQNRMYMDILSGKGPDIIDLSSVNMEGMAEQGYLEDLSPWLEQSVLFDRDDFMDNVLETATCEGMLVGLPREFTLQTMVGRASELGEPGWTLAEFMAYADSHPEAQLFSYGNKDYILSVGLLYSLDSFVDFETGKCSFDSAEFIELLKFANRCGERTWNDDGSSKEERFQRGEVLLMELDFCEVERIQYFDEIFEGKACMVGYPTSDGRAVSVMNRNSTCGISANSKQKEGAWAFLESFVTAKEDFTGATFAFPALKSRMEEMVQTKRGQGEPVWQRDKDGRPVFDENGDPVPEYMKDENGELIPDKNGNPIQKMMSYTMTYYGSSGPSGAGFTITYHPVTDEEMERFMELVRQSVPWDITNQELRDIVYEEAASFFEGQKSAEQAADVIQNRVQLYLDER